VWQQVLQQQLQQDHPLHQSHPMPTLATYAMAEWLEQQQNPHHQEAIASPAWHLPPPTLPPPPPPPPQHQRHDQQSLTSQILPRRPNEAPADESALKWRHLPATLRRRASAQAASALLKAWMRQHADNPYPSKREKLKKDANGSSNGSEFSSSSGSGEGGAGRTTDSSKPRIWSLVETALKDDANGISAAEAAAVDEAALSCWGRNCLSSRCSGYSSLSN
uniref:Homeobox_KN domain-containing protein n=1 Tax=Macrostomum lignano TaxID=282301 RepID=A0A1I8J6Y7_9PLAT